MRRPQRIDRRALCWVAQRFFSARTGVLCRPEEASSILLLRLDERVGNLITLQSLLDVLRSARPQAKVGLLGGAGFGHISRSLQGVDRLHLIDKRWFFQKPDAWLAAIREVRQQCYQVAVDASAWHVFSFNHALLTFYSGAPVRIGYDRGPRSGLHTHLVNSGPPGEYELAQRMRLLVPLGVASSSPPLRSVMGIGQRQRWERWLEMQGLRRPRVGLWVGSRKRESRWPLPFFARLAEALRERRAGVLVLWGPGDEDVRDRLVGAVGEGLPVAPATDPSNLAGLLRGLDLLVTNDTGPMHLSVAVGTSTVCLFVSADPGRWGHPHSNVRNLRVPGRDGTEVQQALQACEELLDENLRSHLPNGGGFGGGTEHG